MTSQFAVKICANSYRGPAQFEVREIEAEVTQAHKVLRGVGSDSAIALCTEKVNLTIRGSDRSFELNNVLVVSELALPEQRVDVPLSMEQELDKQMKLYFDIEAIGISTHVKAKREDRRALEILEATCTHTGREWQVGLPWKEDHVTFSDGRKTALQRLKSLEKKLDRDEAYAKMYYREIDRMFEKGYAQKATAVPLGKRLRYLPHFGVYNINKPNKVRVVKDAAAKEEGVSFNDLLLTGPDLLKSLPGVIMRFRQFAYAVKGDIRDMFLKIKIREEDQDAQRFLWRGADRLGEPVEYRMTSMLFGAKSSPCTAIYIKNKNASRYFSIFPDTAFSLIENCYMDDFLDSCETIESATDRVRQAIEINKFANWEMHGWCSNASEVLSGLKTDDDPSSLVKSEVNQISDEKVLGLRWLNTSDELMFSFNQHKITAEFYSGQRRPTKREFLGIIMSIFDPLGFLTPFTIQSRILMQEIWENVLVTDAMFAALFPEGVESDS
ncbi:uncharacterized protein LOC108630255 [Ceratina calcarata]|uniref:Uncharacterized protein LOC108630255 n=1 Tax=Ceratina calcarata TaxID=156304 RepID=A0AAJ7NCV3_9HYME|nr:uncharacterized protein LOC108630255 [Ceratina calcarata]